MVSSTVAGIAEDPPADAQWNREVRGETETERLDRNRADLLRPE